MYPSFAELTAPTLVVAGDHDQSRTSSRGPEWFTDAYRLSPGATDLLTLFGAEHSLGGIPGYEVAETTDESPERVAVLQQLTTAHLRSALVPPDDSWATARSALDASPDAVGRIDTEQHRPGCRCRLLVHRVPRHGLLPRPGPIGPSGGGRTAVSA